MAGHGPRPHPATAGVRAARRIAAMLLAFVVVAPAVAVQPGEIMKDPVLEGRARDISAGLRCLVCQNQSIDESDAPLAKDLRVLVRERLQAGDSDGQVQDFIVQRYGEFVLLKPAFGPHTAILWLGPVLLLVAGGTGLLLALRRRTAAPPPPLSLEERAAIEAIMGRDRSTT